MASTSDSLIQSRFKYDVFLSFRGPDTRRGFVDHLHHALLRRGITTYKDNERIKKGERISHQLITAIEESRYYIIVFSKNYASSSWCLDELVKIMECQKTTKGHTVYPVFYDVEPTEVRNQSGAVGEAFAKHVDKEAAGRWRDAMNKAADLAGWELKDTVDGHEAMFIEKVMEEILPKLYFINLRNDENLVGMEIRVNRIVSSLKIGFDDIRMIGIKGMGGGGKTTLATAVFDHISIWFEGASFVENVREASKSSLFGLKELQKQVLSDVLNVQGITVKTLSDGKHKLHKAMSTRKVLVVLDDVDSIDQLEALVGERTWFKEGSRIIITTRDVGVFAKQQVDFIHDVDLLSPEEAICLLSRYAFGKEVPIQGYENLSEKVAHYAAGLPLTIKVLGSSLYGKTEREWEDALERLETIPVEETLKRLELSYNGLENDHREIFLEVACILKGVPKDEAIRILESCGFHAHFGLKVLEQKSLITISNAGLLRLHDHIEEMGRNIVRHLHPHEPERHSRLWIKTEIENILVNKLGTEATRSMKLVHPDLDPATFMKGLRKMEKLRVLYVVNQYKHWTVNEVDAYLPNTLQSLRWCSYPFWCLPRTFEANKLVNLEMERSSISQLWEGGEIKVLNCLRFINLSYSKLRTFNLIMTPNLERLDLRECDDFVELHMPIKCAKLKSLFLSGSKVSNLNLGMTPHLEMLDLRECDDFVELHMPIECAKLKSLILSGSKVSNLNLVMTPHLEMLDLRECDDFVELHMPIECAKLKSLILSGSKVSNLNLGMTPHLEMLDLEKCYYLQGIDSPVGCLKKLVYLNLSGCLRFEYLLVDKRHESAGCDSVATLELTAECLDICQLHPNSNLPRFQFECKYHEPRGWSGNLEKLISFGLCACTNLQSFSASICGLQHLRQLKLEGSIPEAPKDLYQLESLEKLSLWMKKIKHLPDSICTLKHLKSLDLKSCWLLEQLPKDLSRLESLEELDITDCISLQDIPNGICKMKCLTNLLLPYCTLVEKLPDELGNLECLKILNIEGTGITHLPHGIFGLKGLCIVWSKGRLLSNGFTSLKAISRFTASCYV